MAKKIKIEQLASEVNRIVTEYSKTTSEGVKKSVRKSARNIRTDIQANAPSKSGAYKKSWATKKTAEKSNALIVTIYSKNRYQFAHLLEHGHANRNGGRTGAQPHIAPAEESGIKLLEADIIRSIKNG